MAARGRRDGSRRFPAPSSRHDALLPDSRGPLLFAGLVTEASAQVGQEAAVELRTVVGCVASSGGGWMLERATEGEPTERAFTSEDELDDSRRRGLGSLSYRLLGVGEFAVGDHDGHKVQVKGLRFARDGELRLNVTSFQPLDPDCR